jgi:CheY-like chemotaxis protein
VQSVGHDPDVEISAHGRRKMLRVSDHAPAADGEGIPDPPVSRANEAMTRLRQAPRPALRARVLAVDDQQSFLAVLRDVLGRTDRLEWVGEADSGEMAIEMAEQLEPDVVLLDVRMPGLGGIEASRRIKARYPSTLVILISTVHPDELPLEQRISGTDAVIWKSQLEPKLLDEIWLRHSRSG